MSDDFDPIAVQSVVSATAGAVASATAGVAGQNDAAADLRAFVERIERLHAENRSILDDIRDVLGEAQSRGYDKKALKRIVALRRKDPDQRRQEEAIVETYLRALGME